MNQALPDAKVTGFELLVTGIEIPDIDDRHVIATAICSNSEIIVTFNLSRFSSEISG